MQPLSLRSDALMVTWTFRASEQVAMFVVAVRLSTSMDVNSLVCCKAFVVVLECNLLACSMCSIALARTARGLPAVGTVHAVEAQPPSFFCAWHELSGTCLTE